ncbi:3-isopropylmalate dehydratase small subunit [Bacillus sp. AGMB 02131]|uniref:3-isopropylmalate dehydratase small subunit n=1 Tax=Peribacillus faecalis TaxID=2772559 RepID=A0A927CV70_9BACI|nr:3-isopropylmalate dehydratase small subunit [Peribacillus faecalis]MBD3108408.1 3-isopropylmalate dehydratase small subunit [Peribacillus faecalis]
MEPITIYKGKTAVLNRANVDTDQIIPKQFLKRIERTGFGQFLFYNWRFNDDGTEREDFELNRPEVKDSTILIAGDNFGCGSSREHAPWSLLDYGFKIVISSSFADIFHQNCLKNGILPIKLSEEELEQLMEEAQVPGYALEVDLPNQVVKSDKGFQASFDIHPYWKEMLVNGWDEISITLQYDGHISEYEKKNKAVTV